MIFCCEAGNTSVKLTGFKKDEIAKAFVIPTKSKNFEYEFVNLLENNSKIFDTVSGCAISCVVPDISDFLYKTLSNFTDKKPFIVNSKVKSPVKLSSIGVKEIGSDRLCNLTGAYFLYGSPVLIADFGTATNFDILSKDNEFTGGIIAPGLKMQTTALYSLTAKLPEITIKKPRTVIGSDTVEEILSGIVNGHAAMVSEMINACENEIGYKLKTVAAGGFAELMSSVVKRKFDFVNPALTSFGLKELYKLNLPE